MRSVASLSTGRNKLCASSIGHNKLQIINSACLLTGRRYNRGAVGFVVCVPCLHWSLGIQSLQTRHSITHINLRVAAVAHIFVYWWSGITTIWIQCHRVRCDVANLHGRNRTLISAAQRTQYDKIGSSYGRSKRAIITYKKTRFLFSPDSTSDLHRLEKKNANKFTITRMIYLRHAIQSYVQLVTIIYNLILLKSTYLQLT